MFSKENRLFTVLILGIVFVAALTSLELVNIINKGNSKDALYLTGFGGMIVGQLFLMARQEQSRRIAAYERQELKQGVSEIKDTTKEIKKTVVDKTNGDLTEAIKTVAAEVKQAKIEPSPGQEQMPRTIGELGALLKTFSVDICAELMKESEATARRVASEAVQKTRQEVEESARQAVRTVVDELKAAGILKI